MPTANSSELTAFRVHPMQGDEIRALRRLQREQELSSHVFMTERDGPMTPFGAIRQPFPLMVHDASFGR